MSEAILKALMQLFALISDIHDDTIITAREKNIVRIFLIRHLNNELVDRYMNMFEEYLGMFNSEKIVKGSLKDRKRISLNTMRILAICETINSELGQKQKVYVVVKLTDYIASGTELTETEIDFLQTVSDAFNIPAREFRNISSFIISDDPTACEHSDVLIIESNSNEISGVKIICNENLKGRISILRIRSTNTYLMRYHGKEPLYLNGQNISEGDTYIFDNGSSIRGSGIKAIYYSEITGYLSSVSKSEAIFLDANDVEFTFRNSSNGIHNLNFHGRSGELVGIIGGSGAGKSTTLSIMSGTLRPQAGKILINGFDLYDDSERHKLEGVVGFVPQDDLLIEELTVFENLYFNARMCLSNLPEKNIREAVDRILADIDLDEARNLKVGNPLNKVISGGQRKRINIALELMREPTILFADEPTSGLSSVDSDMVMNLLKDLTYKNKLVIVNIHQPSSEIYKMFDKIMIIDRGGYQVYYGNPNEAIIYFKVQSNHANADEDQCVKCGNIDTDQILQIIEAKVVDEHGRTTRTRKVSPAEWSRRFVALNPVKSIVTRAKQALPPNSYSIPGLFMQTVIFFSRDLRSKIADMQYIIISLMGPPLLALLLAWFTKTPAGNYTFNENENIPAYLFMCVITSMFFGLMGSSEEIVRDRKILKRESFLNLSWFSYLNSKVMIMFMLSAIQTIAFVLVGNAILEIRGMTLAFWLVLFTTSCFANVLGLNLSSAFRSVIAIYILIPFIIIPQLLFSGVLVKFDKLHSLNPSREFVPVIGELMIARWSFEALAVEQFSNNRYERLFFRYDSDISQNSWYANYLIQDNLRKKILFNYKYRDSTQLADVKLKNYRKLGNQLAKISDMTGIKLPEKSRYALENNTMDSVAQLSLIRTLESMRDVFHARIKESLSLKDKEEKNLVTQITNRGRIRMKDSYTNKSLISLVLDEENPERTGETDTRIYPRYEPGYRKADSPYGRAHFYAPVKKIGNKEISTFTFNLTVIWIITFILYIFLYLKIPEKIISVLENLKVKIND
ncbi:MAG TPA: ATP-binding cassette domain-containing protein [Bacteroidales bacterium]|nr:ATP-binding cassette domain-containing protein [Bacteroidales bacterium]